MPEHIGTTVEADDVSAAAAGDRIAFERLYRRHTGRVYSLCLRMTGNTTRAEELTQDVFVRIWEKLPLFRGESAFTTWMHSLAVNVVLSARKSEALDLSRLTEQGGDGDAESWDAAAGPDKVTFSGERIDLERAIARLPPGARRVFVLHDVEGYKHEELAGMLGITAGGSKAQLHRARLLLRKALMS
ncbi:MAG: RNA polymerase sigma factor [Gemmatimonadaceae bacterium]|nr:RNA polymerase sigma factor [Gemmatimonadaceae bacterium]